MNILGISCHYHDAAAALISDGKVMAAAEEERFSRKKHDSGYPRNSIEFCLGQAGIGASDIDYVVFYEKPFSKLHRILSTALKYYPRTCASFRDASKLWLTEKLWIRQSIQMGLGIPHDRILFSDHHVSHAASSFYPSPYEKAAILTVDGVGEWTTTSWGTGTGTHIKLRESIQFPHSLGLLYSAFTAYLGFEVNEGEWKVMGLAPYGKPRYTDLVWKMVKRNRDGSFMLDLDYFSFHYSNNRSFSDKFVRLFGPPVSSSESHRITERSADIAASIQVVTEEILVHMASTVRKKTGMTNLCLAGGVALNSVANYKILKSSGFDTIFVQPAAGDSGGALGCALYAYYMLKPGAKRYRGNAKPPRFPYRHDEQHVP